MEEPGLLYEAVDRWVEVQPERPAVVAPDGSSLTYAELAERSQDQAAALRTRHGIGVGERVILAAGTSASFVVSYLAVHRIGAIAVPLDPSMPDGRRARIIEEAEPSAAFWDGELTPLPGGFGQRGAGPDSDVLSGAADLMFTSGTTGVPKGVVLTHANLVGSCRNITAFVGTSSSDVELLALPLSHSFGLGRSRVCLWAGASMVLVDGFGRPKRLFAAFGEHDVTGFSMVPAAWNVLRSTSGTRLGNFADRLRYVELGSSPMSAADKRALGDLLPGTRVVMHYGLTEASRAAFQEFHDPTADLISVGRASPLAQISVRDERGEEMLPGDEGEVCVRGPMVMERYWRQPDLTASSFHEDWFRTGDVGVLSPDGQLTLRARLSEVINVGGRKVYPAEVEAAMLRIDGVTDCACVGSADPVAGEVVEAYVVVSGGRLPDLAAVRQALRHDLEPYKLPARLFEVDSIPRTTSGKIQRLRLRS